MVQVAEGATHPGVRFPRRTAYRSRLLFHWRAADLFLNHDPNIALIRPVTTEVPTFTRGSAGGYTVDRLGKLRQWGQAIPRVEMLDLDGDGVWEEPGILLEAQRTNGWTRSEDLANAAWTKTNATIGTAVAHGDLSVDKLQDDATAGAGHYVSRNAPALTNDTQQAVSCVARAAERSFLCLRTIDKNNDAIASWIDLSTGTLGTTDAGHYVVITPLGNSRYRIAVAWDSDAGATTPSVQFRIATQDNELTYDGVAGSGIYLGAIQFEVDKEFSSSYVPTVGATVQRNADTLSFPILFGRRDLTLLARVHLREWLDLAASGSLTLLALTDADQSDYLRVEKSSADYKFAILQEGAAGGAVNTSVTIPAAQADVSVVAQYDHENGRIRIDPGSGAFTAWLSVDDKLAEDFTLLRIGQDEAGSAPLDARAIEAKVAGGLLTAAEIGRLF